jgi:hypothetical protein
MPFCEASCNVRNNFVAINLFMIFTNYVIDKKRKEPPAGRQETL